MADEVGKKHDTGKLRYDLLPVDAEAMIVQVLTFGADKYGPENWRQVPDKDARYYAACRRHLEAWRRGELVDPESGQHHLSHAVCCLLFLLQLDIEADRQRDSDIADFVGMRDLPKSLQRQGV